jgi:maltooligosyltrehalose synthase
MKNLIVLAILGAIGWFGYGKYKAMTAQGRAADPVVALARESAASATGSATARPEFSCDGRTHCSHMRSCAEATYFIQHCPNTQMDGDHDGVPCERQWCN